jgi:hypothetical protein
VARFLLVLQPKAAMAANAMLEALQPLLQALPSEVEHRTPAHLSAMIRGGGESQQMQLYADVQSQADGQVVELVLLSREAMGSAAPQTRAVFGRILELLHQHVPSLTVRFRSDRDGALPQLLSKA